MDSLIGGTIANATTQFFGEMHTHMLAKTPDFLAFAVVLAYCALSTIGVKGSAIFNSIFTMVKTCTQITMHYLTKLLSN